MTHTVVTAPAFTVLDLPVGERILIGLARPPMPGGELTRAHVIAHTTNGRSADLET